MLLLVLTTVRCSLTPGVACSLSDLQTTGMRATDWTRSTSSQPIGYPLPGPLGRPSSLRCLPLPPTHTASQSRPPSDPTNSVSEESTQQTRWVTCRLPSQIPANQYAVVLTVFDTLPSAADRRLVMVSWAPPPHCRKRQQQHRSRPSNTHRTRYCVLTPRE